MDDDFDAQAAFSVASARLNGLRRAQIDSRMLDRPFHGLRAASVSSLDDRDPAQAMDELITLRAQQFAAHMHGGEFFSHSTAAILWGIPLPRQRTSSLHVSVRAPGRAPRGRGVTGHQLRPGSFRTTSDPRFALAVTDPASTWALLGAMLRHPYDLIAAADAIVRIDRLPGPSGRVLHPALATIGELDAAIPAGRRGVKALREALPRVRVGSASRMESWVRLTLVDAGLPEPQLDTDVYDERGRFLGCVDLAYPALRVAIEYEGDHHRTDAAQWHRDIVKHDDLVRAGWRVIRVTRQQLFSTPIALVARVAEALRVAG